jgi:hypothetical protein
MLDFFESLFITCPTRSGGRSLVEGGVNVGEKCIVEAFNN